MIGVKLAILNQESLKKCWCLFLQGLVVLALTACSEDTPIPNLAPTTATSPGATTTVSSVILALSGSSNIPADGSSTAVLTATVLDSGNNPIPNLQVSLNVPTNGGTVSSPATTDSSGHCSFTLTSSTVAGSYNFTASAGTTPQTSTAVAVNFTHGAATHIAFTTQPGGGATTSYAGFSLNQQPIVKILDAYDNIVTTGPDSTALISLSQSGPLDLLGLLGTSSINAVAGVANFSNIGVYFGDTAKIITATKASTLSGGGTAIASVSSSSFLVNENRTALTPITLDNNITKSLVSPDGKIYIFGNFSNIGNSSVTRLVELNADGSLSVNIPVIDFTIDKSVTQSDGKNIFVSTNGSTGSFPKIRRLNSDHTVDSSFPDVAAVIKTNLESLSGGSANNTDNSIDSIAIDANSGSIYIGATIDDSFTSANDALTHSKLFKFSSSGVLDSTFNLNTDLQIDQIVVQSDQKIIILGSFNTINGTSKPYIARLNTNGTVDTSYTTDFTRGGIWSAIGKSIYTAALQSDGKLLIGGTGGIYRNIYGLCSRGLVRVNTDGKFDDTFNDPTNTANSGFLTANGFPQLRTIKLQGDGKILIGGFFTKFNGTARNRVARLNSDGSLDTTFNPGSGASGSGASGSVYSMDLQGDGKIILGGSLTSYNGTARNRIVRINTDGTIDSTFNPGGGFLGGTGVYTTTLQSNGKILVGGDYTMFNPYVRSHFARLNADGSLDTTYNSAAPSVAFSDMAIQSDGKVLLSVDGLSYNGPLFYRLNMDGTLDSGFTLPQGTSGDGVTAFSIQNNGKIIYGSVNNLDPVSYGMGRINSDGSGDSTFMNNSIGLDGPVKTIGVQSDGKIVVGGVFTTINASTQTNIARFSATGILDLAFNSGTGFNNNVNYIKIQNDDKIFVGGPFQNYNGVTRNGLVRLNADGSLDNTFSPNVAGGVYSMIQQNDGKFLIAGGFRLGRINSDGSLDTSFIASSGFNSAVNTLIQLPDGKVLATGDFTSYKGISAYYFSILDYLGL